MADVRAARALAAAGFRLAPVALAVLALAPAARAEVKLVPSVELRETYSDNVGLQPDGLKRGEFITEVTPGLSGAVQTRRWQGAFQYSYHFFKTAGDGDGVQDHANQLSATLHGVMVDDLLFLDAGGTIGQRAISPFGQQINNNPYASANRTEINTWRISPYLMYRFGAFAIGQLRYNHDHVGGGQQVGFGRSGGDTASFALTSGPRFARASWSMTGSRQVIDDDRAGKSSSTNETASLDWSVSRTFSLTATGGYDNYSFAGPGGSSAGSFWTGGFKWQPSSRSSLQASVGRRFFGKTYMLEALHRSRQTTWNIGYSEDVTTMRSQFTLPSAIDTAALLDNLFKANFPDPVARAAMVQEYIRVSGLPPSLADSITYLSNRYMLQKQFQASAAFRAARASMVLSVVDSRRQALSALQSDSVLLGSIDNNSIDGTRMQGLNALWSLQFNSRTALNLAATTTRTQSVTLGRDDDNKALRLGLSSQLRPKLRGTVEVRHVTGTTGGGSNDYTENAVAAALSMQL